MSCRCSNIEKGDFSIIEVDTGYKNGIQQKKMIMVDSSKPIFQNTNVNYNDISFNLYMKYQNVSPNNLEDCIKFLIEIDKQINFNVIFLGHNFTRYSDDVKIVASIGDINIRRIININHFRDKDKSFVLFKQLFDTFKELLGLYVDMIGDDKKPIGRDEYDNTIHNKLLERYFVENSGEISKYAYQLKDYNTPHFIVKKPEPPAPPQDRYVGEETGRGFWMKPRQHINSKPKRKYSLDRLDICDEIYKKTLNWIDSRKDYILID